MSSHESFRLPAAADRGLVAFVDEVFGGLPRVDQRRWAGVYLDGLLRVRGKKTIQRLAEAVRSPSVTPHALRQFINSSPWDFRPARRALARAAVAAARPLAWTTALSVIPKRGDHSVGVHRRFDPETGRTVNCQLGIGLYLASAESCLPVDWRLALDESWLADEHRKRRVRIPDGIGPRPEWAHVLDFAALAATREFPAGMPFVLDLHTLPDVGPVVRGLVDLGQDFLVQVAPTQPVASAAAGHAPRAPMLLPRRARERTTAREFLSHGYARQPHIGAADGGHVVYSGLVHVPGVRGTLRLLTDWCPRRGAPTCYWLTSMVHRRVGELRALVPHASAARRVARVLEHDYGVLDFEGRSFPGWHHHMTMVSAAYAFRSLATSTEMVDSTALRLAP